MKPIVTALAIIALMIVPLPVYADCPGIGFLWDGSTSSVWDNTLNWTYDGGAGLYPGSTAWNGSATISTQGTGWPVMSNDRDICALTMSNGTSGSPTQINTGIYDLDVDGTFTVSDTDSVTYVEKLGSGVITCETFTITADDANPATVKVSGGSIVTAPVP